MAQLLMIGAMPFITRLYPPSEFGALSFISSCIAVASVITNLCYDQAIVLPKTKNDSNQVALPSFLISIAVITFLSFFLFIFSEFAGVATKYHELLWLIPIGALFTGWKDILVSLNTRNKLFNEIAAYQLIIAIVSIFIKIVFGTILEPLSVWLISGNICGVLAGSIFLARFIKKESKSFFEKFTISKIYSLAKKYKKFPVYGTMNRLLDSVSQNLPVFLFSYLFSPIIVGYYGLGSAVLRRPIDTIGISITKVFIQRAANYNANEKNIEPIFKKATLGLAAIAILPFLVLSVFGGKLFGIIFGIEWKTAGLYCQILIPWLFCLLINKPATQVIIVKQKLKQLFYLMVFSIFLRGAAILSGYYLYKSIIPCLILFSTAGVIINSIYIRYAFLLCKKNCE